MSVARSRRLTILRWVAFLTSCIGLTAAACCIFINLAALMCLSCCSEIATESSIVGLTQHIETMAILVLLVAFGGALSFVVASIALRAIRRRHPFANTETSAFDRWPTVDESRLTRFGLSSLLLSSFATTIAAAILSLGRVNTGRYDIQSIDTSRQLMRMWPMSATPNNTWTFALLWISTVTLIATGLIAARPRHPITPVALPACPVCGHRRNDGEIDRCARCGMLSFKPR